MSNLKISPDLFLGVQELNRLKKSMKEDGFQFLFKSLVQKFGVIQNPTMDPNFNFLKVESGSLANTILVNQGYAYDSNGEVIYKPNDGLLTNVFSADIWLWVKIKHALSTVEQSLVSIGGLNTALMTTTNGEFTKILRGQPDYPTVIKFANSTRYTLEYEVLEVIDDNNAIIQGVFDVIETNLQFIVVGTFSPGSSPDDSSKEIFEYDNCQIDLVEETTLNTPPPIITDQEFFLARIMNSSTNGLIIQDKRLLNICKTVDNQNFNSISLTNDVIGLQSVQKFTNRSKNYFIVSFDYKLNVLAETRNYQQNSVSISNAVGGRYKSSADFSADGALDGWKYFYEDGTYNTIIKSVKNSGNIDIYLDELKEDLLGLYIAPDCDFICINALIRDADQSTILYKRQFNFNVNSSNPTIKIDEDDIYVASGGQIVELKYLHKKLNMSNTEQNFNSSTYYTEQAFSAHVLSDVTKTLTDVSPKIGITL